MAYVDISTLMTIATGQPLPAAVVQQIRDNDEFFVDPPACSIMRSAVQSVPNDTFTILTADQENFDNDSMHSTATNTSRITIQTAGRYLFFASVSFAPDADGYRMVQFLVNGASAYDVQVFPAVSAAQWAALTGVKAVVCAAGDYVEVRVRHTAGANLDVGYAEFAALFLTR